MMNIKAQVIKVSLIIYNQRNDYGLHNTQSENLPGSFYNKNRVKVEIIKRETIGNTKIQKNKYKRLKRFLYSKFLYG